MKRKSADEIKAAVMAEARLEQIEAQLDRIAAYADDKRGESGWGLVGDLGHVVELLGEIEAFLGLGGK